MKINNMVITGGLGFIGSYFIRKILGKEYINTGSENLFVVNIDFKGFGSNLDNLKDIVTDKRYKYVQANITNKESLERLIDVSDIDIIVNFAAETHVDRSISNPQAFINSNVNGVVSLLEFCRLHDVPLFIQISTDEVYGNVADGIHLDEDAALNPNSPYSASKASADLLTRAYNRTYGLKTIITRCSNNFGPYQFPEKLIPKVIIRALKRLPIPIYGDGMQIREWIYVDDHVNAILKVIMNGKAGEIYNISSSAETSNIELIEKIRNIMQKIKPDIEFQVDYGEDRPGHDRRYSLDCSKIKRELGWRPEYSFDFSLEQTIKWYIKNEWWWAPLMTDRLASPQPWKVEWEG
jgi:dTDP-glucose 4,6-dehydratase